MLKYAELVNAVPFDTDARHVIKELLLTGVPKIVRFTIVIFPLWVGAETLTPRDATLGIAMESTK